MAGTFSLHITTPEGTLYDSDGVERLTAETGAGEITILRKHTPILTTLKPGALIVHKEDGAFPYAVFGGFLEVRKDGDVVVLADEAVRAQDIDVEEVKRARARAEEALSEAEAKRDVDFARFEAILERSMAQIKAVRKWRD